MIFVRTNLILHWKISLISIFVLCSFCDYKFPHKTKSYQLSKHMTAFHVTTLALICSCFHRNSWKDLRWEVFLWLLVKHHIGNIWFVMVPNWVPNTTLILLLLSLETHTFCSTLFHIIFQALPAIQDYMKSDRFRRAPINSKVAAWGGSADI